MARPPQANAEETRKRILKAAARLFSSEGIHAVGMREVAAAAGVSQPAVHHYFGSKESLHDAVIDAMYDELAPAGDTIRDAVLSEERFERAVETGIRGLYRFAIEHRDAVRLSNREALDSAGKIRFGRAQLLGDALLEQGSRILGELTGKPVEEIRMVLVSLNFLASRYVSASASERRFLLKSEKNAKSKASLDDQRIEDHLVHVAKRLLLP